MTRIAVISNGPSAVLYDRADRSQYDITIGVNKSVTRWRCDWWCFCDWGTFAAVTDVIGKPKIFTAQHVLDRMPTRAPDRLADFLSYERHVRDDVHVPVLEPCPPWYAFSGLLAVGLAWNLNANQVDVFGCDLQGEADCRGETNIYRTKKRWAHERRIWARLIAGCNKANMRVRRIRATTILRHEDVLRHAGPR